MKSLDITKKIKGILYAEHIRSILIASFDITGKCNLHCRHCYNKGIGEKDYLDEKKTCIDIAHKFNDLQIREVTLCGGEPLLSPYFTEFLSLIKEMNIAVRIITNGLLIDGFLPLFNQLLSADDVIQFSIDESLQHGCSQRYTSDSERKIAYDNLARLSNAPFQVIVNITPTLLNQNDITQIVTDAISHGAREIGITPYIPIGGKDADLIKPDYYTLSGIEKEVIDICQNAGVNYTGGISGHICQQIYPHLHSVEESKFFSQTRYCDASNYNIHIASDGTIYPCAFMQKKDYIISHICKSVSEIKQDFHHYSKLSGISLPDKCQTCMLLDECNGGCMGVIIDRYNSLDHIDPRCIH